MEKQKLEIKILKRIQLTTLYILFNTLLICVIYMKIYNFFDTIALIGMASIIIVYLVHFFEALKG